VVSGLIYDEFGRNVTVKHCRRLGKKVANRTQSILVTLSLAEDTTFLIRNARLLSQKIIVCANIFINADLMPAEALSAYEARCVCRQRRAKQQAKTAHKQQSDLMETSEMTAGGSASAAISVTTMKTTRVTRSAGSSHLNPMTPSLTPLVVTADVHNNPDK